MVMGISNISGAATQTIEYKMAISPTKDDTHKCLNKQIQYLKVEVVRTSHHVAINVQPKTNHHHRNQVKKSRGKDLKFSLRERLVME